MPNPAACDSGRIAALARAGDLVALDHLTRCQGERLLAVGRRWCRSDEDAHDAVQDALASASAHLDAYRGEGPLEGWVTQMVARACSRLRRGRKNDPALHVTDVDLTSEDLSPEAQTARAQLAGAIGEAMLPLAPLDRAVLLLAEAEGFSGPEIAAQTGLTPGAVRTRLTRARRQVREHIVATIDRLHP